MSHFDDCRLYIATEPTARSPHSVLTTLQIGNYNIAYAMYQRGDMDFATYNNYKNTFFSYILGSQPSDPFSLVEEIVVPGDDGWLEQDDVGEWIPPSPSDPDGHYTGFIHIPTPSSDSWTWEPAGISMGYDQYGLSQLSDHNLNQASNLFKHTLTIGDVSILMGPDLFFTPYAATELPFTQYHTPSSSASLTGMGFVLACYPDYGDVFSKKLVVGPLYNSLDQYKDHYTTCLSSQFRLKYTKFDIALYNDRLVILTYHKSRHLIGTESSPDRWDTNYYMGDYIAIPSRDVCSLANQNYNYFQTDWGAYDTSRFYDGVASSNVALGNAGRDTSGVWWLHDIMIAYLSGGESQPLSTTICRTSDESGGQLRVAVDSFTRTLNWPYKKTPLYTVAANPYPPDGFDHLTSVQLHTRSYETQTEQLPLVMHTNNPNVGNTKLYTYGSLVPVTVRKNVAPLYMPGPVLTTNQWMPLSLGYGDPTPLFNNTLGFVHDNTGIEDFTTFTVDDGAGQYTDNYTYGRIQATVDNDSSSRLYIDKSAEYFNVAFEVRFQLYVDAIPTTMSLHPVAFTNTTSASSTWAAAEEALAVECYNDSGLKVRLKEYLNEETSASIALDAQRQYYIKVERLGAKVTLSVYTDSLFSVTLVGSVSLSMTSTAKYRYQIVGDTLDLVGGDTMTYTLDNLKYQYMFFEGSMSLVTKGIGVHNDFARLYIKGYGESANSYFPLQVYGSTQGEPEAFWTEGRLSLFLKDTQEASKARTLYIKNSEASVLFSPELGLKLAINGGGIIDVGGTGSIPLVLYNEQIASTLRLYLEGPEQLLSGGEGVYDAVPIYIFRPDEAAAVSLVMYNNTPVSNSYAPLTIDGILGRTNNSFNLVIPHAVGNPNTFMSLWTQGGVPVIGSAPLVIPATLGDTTDSISLMIKHGGGLINSFMPLYTFGVEGVPVGLLPLVLPKTTDIPTDNINLYTQGY